MRKKFRKKHVAQAVAIAFLGTGSVMSSAIASDVVSGQFQVITNDADPAAVTDQGVNPISFRVPAGETEVTVSGYVKADFFFDSDSDLGDTFAASGIPTGENSDDGHFRAHARQTRFRIRSKTDAGGRELKAHVEGDFFGGGGNESFSNSTSFRLRHAYFTVGGWTFGQTWTNFMDFVAYPTTVDFFGPAGKSFARQAQVRYTFSNGFSVSLENPETDGNGSAGRLRESTGGIGEDSLPDLIAAWRGGPGGIGGNYETAVVVRSLGVGGDIDDSEAGFGINLAGAWDVGTGVVAASITGGSGIGRYIINGAGNGLFVTDAGELEAVDAVGASLSYKHRWSGNSSSLVALGLFDNDDDFAANGIDSVQTLHVNYLLSPTDVTTYGVEAIFGDNETVDGNSESAVRLQFSAQLNF